MPNFAARIVSSKINSSAASRKRGRRPIAPINWTTPTILQSRNPAVSGLAGLDPKGAIIDYRSGAEWSGRLAAMLFSLLATLEIWGINARLWLTEYLQACAAAGGEAPADLNPFLPWNLPEAKCPEVNGATPAQVLESS